METTNDINNTEFCKLKLIGYYKSLTPKLHQEYTHVEDANKLAKLLGISFSSVETLSTLPPDFLHDLLHSVLVFKNYQGHLFAYLPATGVARISDVIYNKRAITAPPAEYKFYFAPGDPFVSQNYSRNLAESPKTGSMTKVTLDVIRIVRIDDYLHFEVSYSGLLCYVRLLPFQVEMRERLSTIQQITCVYQGLDEDGIPKLVQDRSTLIDELYEADTVHTFTYLRSDFDYKNESTIEYHIVRDSYGLKHRLYSYLPEDKKIPGNKIDLYVKSINSKYKTLELCLFNAKLQEKVFYDAEKVFEEIEELDNKEQFFDCYLKETDSNKVLKLQRDLIGQYNGESNLWLFTYMNILDSNVIGTCIRLNQMEELAIVCQIMIKLQEWMIEGSTFLDLFSDDTKATTIAKSTSQIQKYTRLLLAIDVIRKGDQYKYISDIIQSIRKSGRIAIRREERIEVMINILRIYPDYIAQDIEATSLLTEALLNLEEGITKREIDFISSHLDYYVEANIRKMRTGTIRSNEIDTTQTLLIHEVLALLCIIVMIHSHERYKNELEARAHKARFFRFLSFVCSEEMQPVMLKAGVDALVGVIDTSNIFTWDNARNINPITLSNLTAQAAVLDSNTDNDYYFMKSIGKTGIIHLDPTGFTIVPYKQCLLNYKNCPDFTEEIRAIHHLETLPLKLGTMFNIPELAMPSDAVEQFLLWGAISKHPENLAENKELPVPKIGDRVLVSVKKQTQPDKLKYMLFVTVTDKRFTSVDGIITPKDITGKWVEDTRTLFKEGQIFYADVCNATADGRYQFSIRREVDKYATTISRVEDDVKNIVKRSDNLDNLTPLSNSFIQELILLIDMRIRREVNPKHRLTLIGYAYCLSALASDPKSYYYDFLLRYYAAIDKFVTNEHKDIEIKFHDTINSKFHNIDNKRRLVELLSYVNSQDTDGLQVLQTLVEEKADSDAGKLAAMLVAYIYAQKAGFSAAVMAEIKDEINKFVCNSDKLDLSALNEDESEDSEEEEQTNNDANEKTLPEDNEPEEAPTEDATQEEKNETYADLPDKESVPVATPQALRLNVFDDGSLMLQEDSPKTEKRNALLEISIPTYARDGIMLLVNNDGGIGKVAIQDIAGLDLEQKMDSKIYPHMLSNHFVVPNECFVGSIINSQEERYIEIYNTEDLPTSHIMRIDYKNQESISGERHQPFILPFGCEIEGISDCMNRSIKRSDIPQTVIEGLRSYGVFI